VSPELAVDHRAFPAVPPPDLDDHEAIVEHDWNAFAAVDRMINHWDRPKWYPGRRVYYWMLTFPHVPPLRDCARHCQEALLGFGMDLIPEDGLHVTMAGIGDTDVVIEHEVGRLAKLAEEQSPESFQMLAHPLAGSRGALRFSLSPWTPLMRLHAALSEVARRTGVPGCRPTSAFRPHLGIAYNNRDRPAAPVIDAVANLRSLSPVVLDVTTVDLVELGRDGATYRWNVVHRLPLARPTAS
jgi:2'-5' RNA ligase